MSDAQKKTVKLLDTKLDNKTIKTLTTCAIVMIIAVLIHDGDHIRQAYNWGYSIPISLWVLNLTVYVLPVVTLFLAKKTILLQTSRRSVRSLHRFFANRAMISPAPFMVARMMILSSNSFVL